MLPTPQPVPLGWYPNGNPTCRIPRLRKREGRCYELALRGCLQAPEWELVHGECNGHNGTRIGHAWLELDGEAYCPVLDLCIPIPIFEKRLQAIAHVRYTADEVLFMKLRHRHMGPWLAQGVGGSVSA